jgi:hypothetical protein
MTTDIFYAIIKLVSGEELISKVCAFIEDGEVLIILDNPVIINLIEVKNIKTPFIKVVPWVSMSDCTTHIINRNHIITMDEIKDKTLVKIHQQYIRNKNNTTNETTITPGMGYVSSITEARKTLEKIYQSHQYRETLD